MQVYVKVSELKGKIKKYAITETPAKVGRNKAAHIVVDDGLCSGFHAFLYVKDDALYVEDLKSKNGVFLNEVRIYQQRIYVGDVIKIGQTKIQVDEAANDSSTLKALAPASSRRDGNITLQLETAAERAKRSRSGPKQKEFVKNSKLYAGASKEKNEPQKGGIGLIMRDYLALLVDLSLAFIVFLIPFFILKSVDPELYARNFEKGISFGALVTGMVLFYTVGALAAGYLFFKWNRSRKSGSIGEKILGLD